MAIVINGVIIPQAVSDAFIQKQNEAFDLVKPYLTPYSEDVLPHLLKLSTEEEAVCFDLLKFTNDNPTTFSDAFPRQGFIDAMGSYSKNNNMENGVVKNYTVLHINENILKHIKKQALLIAYQQLQQNVSMGKGDQKPMLDKISPLFAKDKHNPSVFEVPPTKKTIVPDVIGGTALYVSGNVALRIAFDQSVETTEVAPKTKLNLPDSCKTVTAYNDSDVITGIFEVRTKPPSA